MLYKASNIGLRLPSQIPRKDERCNTFLPQWFYLNRRDYVLETTYGMSTYLDLNLKDTCRICMLTGSKYSISSAMLLWERGNLLSTLYAFYTEHPAIYICQRSLISQNKAYHGCSYPIGFSMAWKIVLLSNSPPISPPYFFCTVLRTILQPGGFSIERRRKKNSERKEHCLKRR